jgi:hypothetical protein
MEDVHQPKRLQEQNGRVSQGRLLEWNGIEWYKEATIR